MADAELSVGLRQVPRDRSATEVERLGDLLGTEAGRGEPHDARFRLGEPRMSHAETMRD
jgi:hypothetical protein